MAIPSVNLFWLARTMRQQAYRPSEDKTQGFNTLYFKRTLKMLLYFKIFFIKSQKIFSKPKIRRKVAFIKICGARKSMRAPQTKIKLDNKFILSPLLR